MEAQTKAKFDEYIKLIDEYLERSIKVIYPERIYESMRYSLLAGGKRLRPVMAIEAARVGGGKIGNILPVACAIEMLHCQSLIHDDLPCMDDDDLRRGKPSNHKMFDEATAVLAGDALLSFAPQLIIKELSGKLPAETILNILNEFFDAAGVNGIISGQIADMQSENISVSADVLDYIHEYKTARLFRLAVRSGAMCAGADEDLLTDLTNFSQCFGHAFQIYDDILDVTSTPEKLGKTPGKDVNAGKATYVSVHGLEAAKKQVVFLCNRAYDILEKGKIRSDILNAVLELTCEGIN